MTTMSFQETSAFRSLHPGLQNYIKNKKWKELSEIQEKAIPEILGRIDCIIEAPTAGGKTEAVLFPTLTSIALEKKPSVQILYLAPLRALLNDIEIRARKYAAVCGVHCFKWHGDVGQREKIEELQRPSQLLLTTPESLEAILLRKAGWYHFFADLEIVIVDEAHNFASGDRGSHLISLLERLEKSINRNPQRIALTATIGNPAQMLQWLAGKHRRVGKRIYASSTIEKEKEFKILLFDERKDIRDDPENSASFRLFVNLYDLLPFKRSIVFAGSRTKTEALASAINQMNKMKNAKNYVKVLTHHSSVSKYYREEAENRIKIRDSIESGLDAIISTSTLELGIDIGELDQVIQIGALSSSSSFLQRVGRTGRRPDKPQFFRGLCTSEDDLILLAAVVSLGLKGISETINFPTRAFHILAHQLICLSLQNHGIDPNTAWDLLSGAHCFSNISRGQFELLMEYMLEEKFLRDVDGLLVVGEKGEEKFLGSNWRRLFAVFDSGPMYDVWEEKKHVGTLDSAFVEALEVPFLFVLGGIEWKANKVKTERREVLAKRTIAGEAPKWVTFSGFDIPYETAKEAGRILFDSKPLNYLDDEAKDGIDSIRNKLKGIGWSEDKWVILTTNYGKAKIWTFAGDRINRTLAKLLTQAKVGIATSSYQNVSLKNAENESEVGETIVKFLNNIKLIDKNSLQELEKKLYEEIRLAVFSKFVKCLPESLWYDALAERIFNFNRLVSELRSTNVQLLK